MSESGRGPRRLNRIGLALAGVAIAAALAIGGYVLYPTVAGLFVHRPTAEEQRQAHIRAGTALCRNALGTVQKFKIVPDFAALTNFAPQTTDTPGRYACLAATDAAKYAVVFDLVCPNEYDARCISLFAILQDDRTVLYQRPQ